MDAVDLVITNVRLAHPDSACANHLWRIQCSGPRVTSARRLTSEDSPVHIDQPGTIDAKGSLMLPSLCHSHIHLDKCFILDRCELITGDFAEALKVTNQAKASFEPDDLYNRGYKLIRDSLECGVTSMRAHVEIDTTVEFSCLQVGLKLSNVFSKVCDIQVAAFAQEPLFDTPENSAPGRNYSLLVQAVETLGIKVVGSAPYVEPTTAQAKANIALVLKLAQKHDCHVDFHLDYNLDPESEPLIYEVISEAKKLSWSREMRITIGHATRMQLFTPSQWADLASAIGELPIIFVGLPQSDMYMLGRNESDTSLGPPRSTLRIPYIANKYGFEMAMSVNNAQNAFTPQGSVDPLSLCTLGVALFQSATTNDIRTLVKSVTLTSKRAIGQSSISTDLYVSPNDPADFVILHGTPNLQSAALNPSYDRTTIYRGVIVARRHTSKWFADSEG
ncbi:hypothetical protein B0H17DRAFT_1162189 [Mycena rosella]|uniref:Metallo-dependent hydrolase n=1 Tax=Mycena rosella TaxID=1033263 RepID=A0AAD7CYU2_MYCRO|nr:hypothetical protein B0H17DRAFT_1162189 [Mycena rosella]